MDIWAEGKDPFNEFCKIKIVLKRKDKHFNDIGYQQEIYTNLNIANSEQNLGPVSKHSNQLKIQHIL